MLRYWVLTLGTEPWRLWLTCEESKWQTVGKVSVSLWAYQDQGKGTDCSGLVASACPRWQLFSMLPAFFFLPLGSLFSMPSSLLSWVVLPCGFVIAPRKCAFSAPGEHWPWRHGCSSEVATHQRWWLLMCNRANTFFSATGKAWDCHWLYFCPCFSETFTFFPIPPLAWQITAASLIIWPAHFHGVIRPFELSMVIPNISMRSIVRSLQKMSRDILQPAILPSQGTTNKTPTYLEMLQLQMMKEGIQMAMILKIHLCHSVNAIFIHIWQVSISSFCSLCIMKIYEYLQDFCVMSTVFISHLALIPSSQSNLKMLLSHLTILFNSGSPTFCFTRLRCPKATLMSWWSSGYSLCSSTMTSDLLRIIVRCTRWLTASSREVRCGNTWWLRQFQTSHQMRRAGSEINIRSGIETQTPLLATCSLIRTSVMNSILHCMLRLAQMERGVGVTLCWAILHGDILYVFVIMLSTHNWRCIVRLRFMLMTLQQRVLCM